MSIEDKQRRHAVLFPKALTVLSIMGENIKLARKRRRISQVRLADRTGLSRVTIRKIENGDPTVSIGHYVSVLHSLGLQDDLMDVAKDDVLGQKLRDIELLKSQK